VLEDVCVGVAPEVLAAGAGVAFPLVTLLQGVARVVGLVARAGELVAVEPRRQVDESLGDGGDRDAAELEAFRRGRSKSHTDLNAPR
jgi:hypothetical protein